MDYIKIKSLFSPKSNTENKKAIHREKIFVIHISDERYINQNKEFLQIKLRTKVVPKQNFKRLI